MSDMIAYKSHLCPVTRILCPDKFAVTLHLNLSRMLTFFLFHTFAENAPDVSDDEIAAAESRFAALQQQVEDANIELLLSSLQEQNEKFVETLQDYDLELAEVEADVANLRDIDSALPVTCANDVPVEQP